MQCEADLNHRNLDFYFPKMQKVRRLRRRPPQLDSPAAIVIQYLPELPALPLNRFSLPTSFFTTSYFANQMSRP